MIIRYVIIIFFIASSVAYAGTAVKHPVTRAGGYDKLVKKDIANLQKLKAEIIAEQNRLKTAIGDYKKAKADMEKTIKRIKNKNYKMIGMIYGNSDPQLSAKSLSLLPTNDAAKILAGMPGRKAGKILSVMKPSEASNITQKMIELGVIKPRGASNNP